MRQPANACSHADLTGPALLLIPMLLDCCTSNSLRQTLTIEHHLLSQVLHITAPADVFTGIEVARGGVQQVCDHLIVYFHEAATQANAQVLTPLQKLKVSLDWLKAAACEHLNNGLMQQEDKGLLPLPGQSSQQTRVLPQM